MYCWAKIREHLIELIGHHKFLLAFVITMLAIQLLTALVIAPAFADISPDFGGYAAITHIDNKPIQLAEANLPPIGSIDDYMHQSGDGPPASPPSPTYSPRGVTPGYAPQGSPEQELNNVFSNPNARRDLLIGAAVVGGIGIGMWAYHQHEQYEAQRHFRRRFHGRRRPFPY